MDPVPSPSTPSPPRDQPLSRPLSPKALVPYGVTLLILLVFLLLAKAMVVFLSDRIVYAIPFLGGLARSLELAELSNLLIFSIMGMVLGLSAVLIPPKYRQVLSQNSLALFIPLIFLSGAFFQYQLWLGDVRSDMGLNGAEVRTITDQWLDETVGVSGVLGFYQYTTLYSILPTNPEDFSLSVAGNDRVTTIFDAVLPGGVAGVDLILSLSVWLLRLFYFILALGAGLYHYQDGYVRGETYLLRNQSKVKNSRKTDRPQRSSRPSQPSDTKPSPRARKSLDQKSSSRPSKP